MRVFSGPAISIVFGTISDDSGVKTVTLAQVLDRLPERKCDLLKVECDGCEHDLLLGCPLDILASAGRTSAKTHDLGEGRTAGTLAAFLSKYGFQVIRLPNLVHDHMGFLCAERV